MSLTLPAVRVVRICASPPAVCSLSDMRFPLLSAHEFSHQMCDEESLISFFLFLSIIIDHFHLKFHVLLLKIYPLHKPKVISFFHLFYCSFPLWFPLKTIVWGISSRCINFSLMISTFPLAILRDCLCFMCQISLWHRAKPVLLFNLIYTWVQQQQQQQNLEWKWYIPIFPCESAPSAITCQSQYRITCFCFHFPYAPSFHIVNLSHLIHSIGSYLFFSVPHILFSFNIFFLNVW